jgi:hypothetical protein
MEFPIAVQRGLTRRTFIAGTAALSLGACAGVGPGSADPLRSWNDGPNKQAILAFVADVTRDGAPTFVPPPERIAVFDNDGTLWAEQPMYFQFLFMFEQVKAAAAQHPQWRGPSRLQGARRRDHEALHRLGEREVLGFVLAPTPA